MNTRAVVSSVLVIVGVGTVLVLKSLEIASDANSVDVQTFPAAIEQERLKAAEQEQPEDHPISPPLASDEEEPTSAVGERQLSPDQELLASTLIAEMQGSRSNPVQPWFVQLVRDYAREGIDPNWSAATENRIYQTIAEVPEIAVANIDVQCRTTICRLSITHPPSEPTSPQMTGATVLEIVEQSGLMPLYGSATRDELGNPISLAYLRRGERDTSQPLDIQIRTNP